VTPTIILLVLGSALLHASWNALLRADNDRLKFIAVMNALCAIIALPVGLLAPRPSLESLPYLFASAVVQVGYCLLLVRAYRDGHLAQVYPITWRGAARRGPGCSSLRQRTADDARRRWGGVGPGGIAAVAAGRGRPDARTVVTALATGVTIATYMLIDGLGVRRSGAPIGYIAWQAVAQGFAVLLTYIALTHRWPAMALDMKLARIGVGAAISLLAYGVVIWAAGFNPMGQVSALRETSILFAVLISAIFLRERLSAWGVVGAILIAAGAVSLSSA
jgi:drug/metabolite transporter (DMT)-like permease